MTHELTITLSSEDIDKIVREELISAFGTLETDIELTNAFARAIKYYSTASQFKKFCKEYL